MNDEAKPVLEGLRIVAFDASRTGDWLDFFDERAFADHKDWQGCYCCSFHNRSIGGKTVYDGESPVTPGGTEPVRKPRRDRAEHLLRAGFMRGYVAYVNERVIGWCNVNRKSAFAALDDSDSSVLRVVCFVVEKDYRRKGVSRALMTAAVADAKSAGYKAVEARPSFGARSASGHFRGHPDMFAELGFVVSGVGKERIVRLDLGTK